MISETFSGEDVKISFKGNFKYPSGEEYPTGRIDSFKIIVDGVLTEEATGVNRKIDKLYDRAIVSDVDDTSAYSFLFARNDTLKLSGGNDIVSGFGGKDKILGRGGDDTLDGGESSDDIRGGGGNDFITGGTGRDILKGGSGIDTFDFNAVNESKNKAKKRDVIKDFDKGTDRLDVSDIDAIDGGVDDGFVFIGKSKFSETAGELRFSFDKVNKKKVTIVEGDVDGDGVGDFEIELSGKINLPETDFIL
ncbi:MAG: M10 family metallopeptidase C-terminal domain-containing protein [Pseudomonadota bacterium]